MNSWLLWRRIVQPPQSNALYGQAVRQGGPPLPWYVGCAEMFAFVFIIPLIFFMGPVYSFGWVVGMSGDIARARENGTLDLISLTPAGPLGASFAIALAALHREGALARANQRATWAGRLGVVGVLAFVSLFVPQMASETPHLAPFFAVLIIAAALIPDHIQSVSLAFAAALLGAETSPHRATAQWSAFTLLLAFHMGAYGAALTVFLLLAPGDDGPALIGATMAALVALFLLREALFIFLWRALVSRFGEATVLDQARDSTV